MRCICGIVSILFPLLLVGQALASVSTSVQGDDSSISPETPLAGYLTRSELDAYRFRIFESEELDSFLPWTLPGVSVPEPTPQMPREPRFGLRISRDELSDAFTDRDLIEPDLDRAIEDLKEMRFKDAFRDAGGRVEFWLKLWEF
ncbi:MAG: hypothetical protein EOM25_08670 [Deltaproteobacteria bacterium]|nr:hypothetical protein [Deltaproteobacteria bacterium]